MATYIISYDLSYELSKSKNYSDLHKAIQNYAAWARITESTWAVKTSSNAIQIRENLSSHLDSDDRIFVVKSGTEAAWRNVMGKNEWFKEHL